MKILLYIIMLFVMFFNVYNLYGSDEYIPCLDGIPAVLYEPIIKIIEQHGKAYGLNDIKNYKIKIQLIKERTSYEVSFVNKNSDEQDSLGSRKYIFDFHGNLVE